MVLAETIEGKISMGLMLHEQRAKRARDCQGLCCYSVPLWPGAEKRFSNTLRYFTKERVKYFNPLHGSATN